MKCVMCNKEMDKVEHWLAGHPVGPVCWKRRMGASLKIAHAVVKLDQLDFFGENMINEEFAEHVSRLFVKPQDHIGRVLHAAVGISGEAGEVLDTAKKTWVYGKELDRENILEESGDLLFYISALLTETGFTMEEAMTKVHTLADQFAQALANGELTVNDIGYVLEHVDGYLKDYQPDTYTFMTQEFSEIATELYKAHDIATGGEA